MSLEPGAYVGPYRILGSLGAGGMGEVYRARDDRLDRDVAIKTLASGLTSNPDRVARFTREAKAAAALNHPNILAVHDVGMHDGEPFLVTELLDGRTLRQVLAAGRPRPDEVVNWALQICEGLTVAHERGIVHRDLKPENLFLTNSGQIKILDFGLAKLIESAADGVQFDAATATQTAEGVVLGTVGYMAPEQVSGRPCDHRGDLFALGCVLYELLSGERAFSRSSVVETLSSILKEDPPSLEGHSDVSPGIARIVSRCLQKTPSGRFQSARDLAFALTEEGRRPQRITVSGSTSTGSKWRWVAATTVVAIVVAGAVWSRLARTPSLAVADGPSRLVVLPFDNLSQQPADAWLAGAFSDALTLNLRSAENLLLVDRARVLELSRSDGRGGAEATRRLVNALGVRYYVTGSYQRAGEVIRVVARLVNTENDAIAVQESMTDRFENLFGLQDELGRRFASALHQSPMVGRSSAGTKSLAAYQALAEGNDLYLLGRYREAAERLESAVRLDENYPEAWAMLGKAYGRLGWAGSREANTPADVLERGLRAATKAVTLNPVLYEGQVALALAHRLSGQREDTQRAAQRAIDLNPRLAEAYALLADTYHSPPTGSCSRPRDAELGERLYRKALEIDPRWAAATASLVYHLSWLGRDGEALEVADRASQTSVGNVGIMRARATALLFLGRAEEAEAQLHQIVSLGAKSIQDEWELAGVELMKGNHLEAEKRFAAIIATGPTTLRELDTARLYAVVGDLAGARRHIDAAVRVDASCRDFVDSSSAFAALRADRRSLGR